MKKINPNNILNGTNNNRCSNNTIKSSNLRASDETGPLNKKDKFDSTLNEEEFLIRDSEDSNSKKKNSLAVHKKKEEWMEELNQSLLGILKELPDSVK